jgi:exodeoxyribonuclease V beta subunit
MPEILDPLRLPLWGSRLIEASAGTGKTWTIGALYLRLVLGAGAPGAAFAAPLLPEQILVMTFTRAATQELSERIRARLAHAAACFRGSAVADDPFLQELLAGYAPGPARERAAWRLGAAAEAMDGAAVCTIDAWCQRMLREHAFDSGSLFDVELVADERALRAQAARDVWRQEIYPLRGEVLDGVLEVWADLAAFEKDLAKAEPGAARPLGEVWEQASSALQRELEPLRPDWVARGPRLRAWLEAELPRFNAGMVKPARVAAWFDAVAAWAGAPRAARLELEGTGWARLSCAGLRAALRKGQEIEIPPEFDAFVELAAAHAALPDAAALLRAAGAARLRQRLLELKDAARTYGFDDMLQRLAAALAGPRGEALRQRIREQFPVALIDEFQDTSSVQFGLFDRIYGLAANDPRSAILLIGDPKQSIYRFRGADIHSYLLARAATAERLYALGTNFRATTDLVGAVNRLFEHAEARPGAGAFQFRDAAQDALPFLPVQARGRAETLVAGDVALPALQLAYAAAPTSMPAARQRFAELCAEHLVGLLNAADCGLRDAAFTRLRPADLAVLVRNGTEAAAVRAALQRRGVASVYLSERDSVFASQEALDLLRWLRAVAQPRDGGLLRAAFASPSLGLELAELAALAGDDALFEARSELLLDLHAVWQRQGVLPMLRQTLHRLDLPARWLQQAGGERRLTNVLHLAELLQQAASQLEGEQALLRWLARQLADAGSDAQSGDQQLRLESEADLVRVVTIHKSKGLEYPFVYLPYAGHFKPDADADAARLQEDLRLLYVALTRARHGLWVGVAPVTVGSGKSGQLHRSAIGYLLGASEAEQELPALLEQVFGGMPTVRLEPAAALPAATRLQARAAAPALQLAAPYAGRFERDWSISSFTALVRGLGEPAGARRAALANLDDDAAPAPPGAGTPGAGTPGAGTPGADASATLAPRHAFARGAFAGKFLHDQLAWLATQGFGLARNPALRERLAQRCERAGWGQRAEQVGSWFAEIETTSLRGPGVELARLQTFLPEMEFWFPVAGGSAARIDAICGERLLPGRPRAALGERQLQGLLMGFADLVFEWQGRWWVLDYKSNVLGEDDAAYADAALAAAVAAHRYDVQAMLYLLALHRLLRARLGADYDPRRQLGGALDLFLRGIRGPAAGCFVMPADVELLDALDAALGGDAR